ncbi:MAG: type II secretion system major pseudopilin GspG [Thiotrichales bacterium]|nr:type II secretion system major pseudopilin GspG [Thiotrichales bacterium]
MLTRNEVRDHGRSQIGFTLIEIMVVVVILGILAAVVAPKIFDKPDDARIVKAKQDIRVLENALNLYRLDNFNYPQSDIGLRALVEKPADAPNWAEGGYMNRIPKDPWLNEYQYLNPGVHGAIDIFTYGRDGSSGGESYDADIGNWNL